MEAYKVLNKREGRLESWWAEQGWKRYYYPGVITYPIPGSKLYVFRTEYYAMEFVMPTPETVVEIWRVICPDLESVCKVCTIWDQTIWGGWWRGENPAPISIAPMGSAMTSYLTLKERIWPLNT